tara:strand:+ start:869 stop:1228 length:360 start_codon:yes stop_codon:yes gene_type:complete
MSTSTPKELISEVPSTTDMFPFIVVAKSDTTDLVCVIAAKSLENANKLIAFEDMDELFGFEEGQLDAYVLPVENYSLFYVEGKSLCVMASESEREQRIFDADDVHYTNLIENHMLKPQQ